MIEEVKNGYLVSAMFGRPLEVLIDSPFVLILTNEDISSYFYKNKEALMLNLLNGAQVRDYILNQDYDVTESSAYAWVNITEEIVKTGKGTLIAQSGSRIGSSAW